jgi:hypothetical protein
MRPMKSVICVVALAVSLAPAAALASSSKDHSQAELANAQAQLQVAQQQATDIADQAALSATNEQQIAIDKSEVLRQAQLNDVANAAAMQQQASQLADEIRAQGDQNARNELAILQLKASLIVAHADASLTNALAMGRPDEIANAQAQSAAAHQLADYLTGTLAAINMSSVEVSANDSATALTDEADVQAQNDMAMGDDDLFASDTILNDGEVSAESAALSVAPEVGTLLGHAEASLENAEAQADEAAAQ